MTYAQFRDMTIKLLNQFSASGNLTPLTDAAVQDAVLRLPVFANSSQFEIATTAKYIHKKHTVTQVGLSPYISTNPKYIEYTMPTNFFKLNEIQFNYDTIPWVWTDKNKYAIRSDIDGEINFLYFAYPTEITDSVLDSFVFDLDEEACKAIPYYCAYEIFKDDPVNKSTATKLLVMYQNKLANLNNTITKANKSVKNTMFSSSVNKLF